MQPAESALIVWSEGQIKRIALNGAAETVLLNDDPIRAMRVSPDGTKVAVMYGNPGTLLVLDAKTGEELLRVAHDHPSLQPLRPAYAASAPMALGDWRWDGGAVGVSVVGVAVVTLDGGIRVLPEDLRVSPDLRYALRFGESVSTRDHQSYYESLDVLDVETGEVVWTVSGGDEGVGLPQGLSSFWMAQEKYVAFNGAAGDSVLNTASGEVLPLSPTVREEHSGPIGRSCSRQESYWTHPCAVRYEGRVVWEGAGGWTQYHGLIESVDGFSIHGVELAPATRRVALPAPPLRGQMVGPLLLYEIAGEYSAGDPGWRSGDLPARHVFAHDAGTGRKWVLATDIEGYPAYRRAQAALEGVAAAADQRLIHVTPTGKRRTLLEGWTGQFRVSPDHTKVAVHAWDHVAVLELPTGREVLRVERDDLAERLGLRLTHEDTFWSLTLNEHRVSAWTTGSDIMLVSLAESDGHGALVYGVLADLNGDVRLSPCVADWDEALSCLSPDTRYAVLGRAEDSRDYVAEYWRSFDITEWRTGRVLWTVETAGALRGGHREWASEHDFAWSSGDEPDAFTFHERYRNYHAPDAEVSVIDVRTGEIEVMDGAEYLARFHPPPRATTECPEHPAHACRILLDGEVVGEGRWPRIIGFVELGEE